MSEQEPKKEVDPYGDAPYKGHSYARFGPCRECKSLHGCREWTDGITSGSDAD